MGSQEVFLVECKKMCTGPSLRQFVCSSAQFVCPSVCLLSSSAQFLCWVIRLISSAGFNLVCLVRLLSSTFLLCSVFFPGFFCSVLRLSSSNQFFSSIFSAEFTCSSAQFVCSSVRLLSSVDEFTCSVQRGLLSSSVKFNVVCSVRLLDCSVLLLSSSAHFLCAVYLLSLSVLMSSSAQLFY